MTPVRWEKCAAQHSAAGGGSRLGVVVEAAAAAEGLAGREEDDCAKSQTEGASNKRRRCPGRRPALLVARLDDFGHSSTDGVKRLRSSAELPGSQPIHSIQFPLSSVDCHRQLTTTTTSRPRTGLRRRCPVCSAGPFRAGFSVLEQAPSAPASTKRDSSAPSRRLPRSPPAAFPGLKSPVGCLIPPTRRLG